MVGGLIGYLFSKLAIYVELKYNFTAWFTGHVKSKLELRRQIAHLLIGMAIVFLIDLKLLTPSILAIILIAGVALSFIYRYRPVPIIKEILHYFERPQDIAILPGKGPIFWFWGLCCLDTFPRHHRQRRYRGARRRRLNFPFGRPLFWQNQSAVQ